MPRQPSGHSNDSARQPSAQASPGRPSQPRPPGHQIPRRTRSSKSFGGTDPFPDPAPNKSRGQERPNLPSPRLSRTLTQSPEMRPTSASGSTPASGGSSSPANASPLTPKPNSKNAPAIRRGSPGKPSTKPRRPTRGRPATLKTGQLRWTTRPSSDPLSRRFAGADLHAHANPLIHQHSGLRLAAGRLHQHGARHPGDKQREIQVPARDIFCQRSGPLGGPPITGNSCPDQRTRGSIQLPRLMLDDRHSAALSEAFSSH